MTVRVIGYRFAIRAGRSTLDCPGAGRAPDEYVSGLGHHWGICPVPSCRRQVGLTRSGADGGTIRRHKVADFQSAAGGSAWSAPLSGHDITYEGDPTYAHLSRARCSCGWRFSGFASVAVVEFSARAHIAVAQAGG